MKFSKIDKVTVNPGDLGKKFFFFQDASGGRVNRPTERKKVKDYSKKIDAIARDGMPIYLVTNGKPGKFFVFDGQHRVEAASSGDKPVVFNAVFIQDEGSDFTNELLGAHETKRFTMNDRLFVSQHASPWPKVAESLSMDISFKGKGEFPMWSAIVQGRIIADRIHAQKSLNVNRHITTEDQMKVWREADQDAIFDTLQAVKWWTNCLRSYAGVHAVSIRSFRGGTVLGVAIAAWEANDGKALEGAHIRMSNLKNTRLGDSINYSNPIRDIATGVMKSINYGRHANVKRASLYGCDGQED